MMNSNLRVFAARLAAKLGLDPEHRYWTSAREEIRHGNNNNNSLYQQQQKCFFFLDVTVHANGDVVFGCFVWKEDPNDEDGATYTQSDPLTMEMIQEHFSIQIAVDETDPRVLADHFANAILQQGCSIHCLEESNNNNSPMILPTCISISYETGDLSFLGSRPLSVFTNDQKSHPICQTALDLILNLKDQRSSTLHDNTQLSLVENAFLSYWNKFVPPVPPAVVPVKPKPDVSQSCIHTIPKPEAILSLHSKPDKSSSEEKFIVPSSTTSSTLPTPAVPAAAITKKVVKKPKFAKKKKNVTGLKFEGE